MLSAMFLSCKSLKNFDLSGWNVSSMRSTLCMFEGCSGLKCLNLSGWKLCPKALNYRLMPTPRLTPTSSTPRLQMR